MDRFCTRCGAPLTAGVCSRCSPEPVPESAASPRTTAASSAGVAALTAGERGHAAGAGSLVTLRNPATVPVALCVLGVAASGAAGPLGSLVRLVPVAVAIGVLCLSGFVPETLQRHLARHPELTRLRVEAAALLVLLVLGVPRTMTWGIPLLVAGVVLFAQRRLLAEGIGTFSWRPLWPGGWGRRAAIVALGLSLLFLVFAAWVGEATTRTSYTYGGLFASNSDLDPALSAFDAGYALVVVPALVVAVCAFVYRPQPGPQAGSRARSVPSWLPWGAAGVAWLVAAYAALSSASSAEAVGGAYGSYVQQVAAGPFLFCLALLPFVWLTWRDRRVPHLPAAAVGA